MDEDVKEGVDTRQLSLSKRVELNHAKVNDKNIELHLAPLELSQTPSWAESLCNDLSRHH